MPDLQNWRGGRAPLSSKGALPRRTTGGAERSLNKCLKERILKGLSPVITGAKDSAETTLWTQIFSVLSLEMVPVERAETLWDGPDLHPQGQSLISGAVWCVQKFLILKKKSYFLLAQSLLYLENLTSPFKEILLKRENYTPPSLVYSSAHGNLAFQKLLSSHVTKALTSTDKIIYGFGISFWPSWSISSLSPDSISSLGFWGTTSPVLNFMCHFLTKPVLYLSLIFVFRRTLSWLSFLLLNLPGCSLLKPMALIKCNSMN